MVTKRFLGISVITLILTAMLSTVVVHSAAGKARSELKPVVLISDDCDAATFNATFGPGTCVGEGTTTVAQFLAEFGKVGHVFGWDFTPHHQTVRRGDEITLANVGGERHTFTKVAKFGGGFVGLLNGGAAAAPECASTVNGKLVPQPASATNLFLAAGQSAEVEAGDGPLAPVGANLYQCCIHPWMHATIKVTNGEAGE